MEPCAALNLSTCGGAYVRRAEATGRLHAESRKVVEAQTPTKAIFANGSLAPSAQKLTIRISGKDVEIEKKENRRENQIDLDQPREKIGSIRKIRIELGRSGKSRIGPNHPKQADQTEKRGKGYVRNGECKTCICIGCSWDAWARRGRGSGKSRLRLWLHAATQVRGELDILPRLKMEIPVFLPEGGQTLHVPMEEKREHVISFVLKF